LSASPIFKERKKKKSTTYDYVYRELKIQSIFMINKKSLHELTLGFMKENKDLIKRINEDLEKEKICKSI